MIRMEYMKAFTIHTQIFLGEHALAHIAQFPIRRACIVSDPFMIKSGAVERVTGVLEQMGANWEIFDRIISNPTIELVS